MSDSRQQNQNGTDLCGQAGMDMTPPIQFPSFRGFRGESQTDSRDNPVRAAAEHLLASPSFFTQCLDAMRRMGLVGEKKNALALYVVGTSRLLPRPINVFVKGPSITTLSIKESEVARYCTHSRRRSRSR
jgi:hypothetical protein